MKQTPILIVEFGRISSKLQTNQSWSLLKFEANSNTYCGVWSNLKQTPNLSMEFAQIFNKHTPILIVEFGQISSKLQTYKWSLLNMEFAQIYANSKPHSGVWLNFKQAPNQASFIKHFLTILPIVILTSVFQVVVQKRLNVQRLLMII